MNIKCKGENMKELVFEIKDKIGLHARPAGLLSENARKFSCDIIIRCDGKEANAKRLLSVMSLGASYGKVLSFVFDGEDENEALDGLEELIASGLDHCE
jgi:phosphocarrier protein